MYDRDETLRKGVGLLQFTWAEAHGVEWIDVSLAIDSDFNTRVGAAAAAVLHIEFHPEQRGRPDNLQSCRTRVGLQHLTSSSE